MTPPPRGRAGSRAPDRAWLFVSATGLATLVAAGLVLATSWWLSFPTEVVSAAWLVAITAMVVVCSATYREARVTGTGFLTALGRALKALGRFVYAFF